MFGLICWLINGMMNFAFSTSIWLFFSTQKYNTIQFSQNISVLFFVFCVCFSTYLFIYFFLVFAFTFCFVCVCVFYLKLIYCSPQEINVNWTVRFGKYHHIINKLQQLCMIHFQFFVRHLHFQMWTIILLLKKKKKINYLLFYKLTSCFYLNYY